MDVGAGEDVTEEEASPAAAAGAGGAAAAGRNGLASDSGLARALQPASDLDRYVTLTLLRPGRGHGAGVHGRVAVEAADTGHGGAHGAVEPRLHLEVPVGREVTLIPVVGRHRLRHGR